MKYDAEHQKIVITDPLVTLDLVSSANEGLSLSRKIHPLMISQPQNDSGNNYGM